MYFRDTNPYKMLARTEPDTNLILRGITRSLISSNAAGINEGKKLLLQYGFKCAVHVIIQMQSHNQ